MTRTRIWAGLFLAAGVASQSSSRDVTLTTLRVDLDRDGTPDEVSIVMAQGTRVRDRGGDADWCGAGDRFEGSFTVVTRIKGSRFALSLDSLLGGWPLSFSAAPWTLVVDDYNDDEMLEFNLGQYASCNGNDYWMFSIDPKGRVRSVSGAIRVADRANSTRRFVPIRTGFQADYYGNDDVYPGHRTQIFQWNPTRKQYLKTGDRPAQTEPRRGAK